MAMFLQGLAMRLGMVTRKDLAQVCRAKFYPWVNKLLWISCETAIAACDLAEVIGSAIAMNLLFGLPIIYGCLVTAADVLRATDFVVPCFEIVDSRIRDWKIKIQDTVADNASSGYFTIGLKPVLLKDVDVGAVTMSMTSGGDVVSSGTGSACMGNPVNAVVWLANTLQALGKPLRAGDVLLSGALGPMVSVTGPSRFEATIDGLGTVRAEFVDG